MRSLSLSGTGLALFRSPWHSLALFLVLSLALFGIRCLALFFLTLYKNLRKNPCLKNLRKILGWNLASGSLWPFFALSGALIPSLALSGLLQLSLACLRLSLALLFHSWLYLAL